jgi:hypothetical protein
MRHYIATTICLAAVTALTGCASPHVVETSRTSDANLSCIQLDVEMKEADRFKTDAQKEKGMTGTNVAAVLFFWPAMIGTYANANEAIEAANTRKANLMRLYEKKGCDGGVASGSPQVTPEVRLQSLKDMLSKGLITQVEHDERRAKILASM